MQVIQTGYHLHIFPLNTSYRIILQQCLRIKWHIFRIIRFEKFNSFSTFCIQLHGVNMKSTPIDIGYAVKTEISIFISRSDPFESFQVTRSGNCNQMFVI